jgi:ATP-dependent Lhr-like helicase
MRDSNNLLFAGSRRNVEELADRLRRRSDEAGLPNAFLPHHGNLSRELREEVEARLKDGSVPTTAVATTTLELRIDIGSVASVAQLGAPRSLAGLRQRLGRSGRRADTSAVLRIYVREPAVPADLLDRLRLPAVREVEAMRLLLARFVEPPERHDPALLSVAVQQILSLIVEQGGIAPAALHRALFASPPLSLVPADLAALLRGMADMEAALIEQAPDGLMLLCRDGERITERRDFYANFETDEEWTLVAGRRTLDTIPLANAVAIGGLIGFTGRRWRITAVDDRARVVQVTAHPAGRLPMFENGSAEPIHDRLAAEMWAVPEDDDTPRWLDGTAADFLAEGWAAWRVIGGSGGTLIEAGRSTHLLTWRGTAFNGLTAVLFVAAGLHAEPHDIGVAIEGIRPAELASRLPEFMKLLDIRRLSESIEALRREKYDGFVPEPLLRSAWADRHVAILPELQALLRTITAEAVKVIP